MITGERPWSAPMIHRSGPTGPTCPKCLTIHGERAAVAVGRFDPDGVHGYRSSRGGPLRPTRAAAIADFCAATHIHPHVAQEDVA